MKAHRIPDISIHFKSPVAPDFAKKYGFYIAKTFEARIEAGLNERRWSLDGI